MPKAKKEAPQSRPTIYPVPVSELFIGEKALTVAKAKELLGWREVESGEYMFIDKLGKKICLDNNDHNRPYDPIHASKLAQVILNSGPGIPVEKRRWQFNFENIIIGTTGRVCSGQHRLVGLVLAGQLREIDSQKYHWADVWPGEPTIETSIGFGANEAPYVTRTFDNVKTRTFADVCYTDPRFDGLTAEMKKICCKMSDHAVRMLWARTGAKDDPFSPFLTHADGAEFMERHPRMLRAVKHIAEENKGASRPIGRFFSPGYASAFCFLMGCSTSDSDAYRNAESPNDKILNWDRWEQACNFWVELAKSPGMEPLRQALANLKTAAEKKATLAKAWVSYLENNRVLGDDLKLAYRLGEFGENHLAEWPTLGGIDLGEAPTVKTEKAATSPKPGEPTPEQIEAQKAAIKQENGHVPVSTPPAPSSTTTQRAPGEVAAPEPVKHDKDGKPPAPLTRRQQEAANTAAAVKADGEKAKEAPTTPPPTPIPTPKKAPPKPKKLAGGTNS